MDFSKQKEETISTTRKTQRKTKTTTPTKAGITGREIGKAGTVLQKSEGRTDQARINLITTCIDAVASGAVTLKGSSFTIDGVRFSDLVKGDWSNWINTQARAQLVRNGLRLGFVLLESSSKVVSKTPSDLGTVTSETVREILKSFGLPHVSAFGEKRSSQSLKDRLAYYADTPKPDRKMASLQKFMADAHKTTPPPAARRNGNVSKSKAKGMREAVALANALAAFMKSEPCNRAIAEARASITQGKFDIEAMIEAQAS